ncbi:MAG: helix-hairpin-helix domain-containing protein [Phycisphaerales bacterium]|nr:helix-hairpin-helix domain-containing protein [Phycisphaerales bacterium]
MANAAYNTFGDFEGVGPDMADHLWRIDMRSKQDIADADPELMYKQDSELAGGHLDRCVLYVYRCVNAVCKAEQNNRQLHPDFHKWWNWSDKNLKQRSVEYV